jgi:diguanylate cyclase (GGDEF)-like protein/PAS domain S-box-containing protein
MLRTLHNWRMRFPAAFLAALIVAGILTAVIGAGYKQDGLLFGGETDDYTVGWKTTDGRPVALPGLVSDGDTGDMTLTNTLPKTLDNNAVLFLETSFQPVIVTVGGERIYSWEPENKAMMRRPFGLSCYIIPIPSAAAGQTILLQFDLRQNGEDMRIYKMTLGNAISTATQLVMRNLDTVILFFVLTGLFILIFISALLFRKREGGFGSLNLFYLSIFIALAAVWMISDSELALLFTTNVAVTLYCALLSLMLLPFPIIMFVQHFVRKYKRLLGGLAALVLMNFFVCTALAVFGIADLIQTSVTTHILELLSCVVITTVSTLEYTRHKRRELLSIPVGLGVFCLMVILETILFSVTGNPFTSVLFRIGLTVFVASVGFGVIRRSFSELINSRSYVNLTRSIPSGICRIDGFENWRIVFANDFYYKMFGYTPSEAKRIGFDRADFTILSADLEAIKQKIEKNFAYNFYRIETESRHRKKNGEIIWILTRYRLDPFGHGAITAVMIDITDRKQMEEQLRINEEQYRIATLHSSKKILRFDIQSRTCHTQQDTDMLFGLPSVLNNVPDSIIESGVVAQDSVPAFRSFFDAILRGDREGRAVISMFNRSIGEYGWYHFDFTSIFGDDDKPIQAIVSFYDVTHQRQKELAFQRWQQSYNSIPKNATNYYEYNLTGDQFEHEEGGMLPSMPKSLSRRLSDVAAYFARQHVAPEDAALWLEFMSRDRLLERYANGQYTDKLEFRRLCEGGSLCWTSLGLQLIPDPYSSTVKGYFLLEDIDAQKKAELVLHERSMRDSLTGLLNRGSFIEQFNEILRKSDLQTQHALIMLDIDNFKTINDSLGHAAGDALLVNIAGKLKYALRSEDLCGRLGGDEFVIFLKNMNRGKPLETRVNDLCTLVCNEQMHGVSISASFGIAGFPNDGVTFEELYKKADVALYKVKSSGRGGFALYDPQLSFDDLSVSGRRS